MPPLRAVLLDIDGTLLDSNEAHAQAWVQACASQGLTVPFERVRALIGMGSDKLLRELLDVDVASDLGERLSEARRSIFLEQFLPTLQPTPGARDLVQHLREQQLQPIIATSATGPELEALLRQAQVADLIDEAVTSDDAEHSKPDPDIVAAALARAGTAGSEALMVGDTPYDVTAARDAGVQTLAVRCGGWWDDEALSGAAAVFDDPAAIVRAWGDLEAVRRGRGAGA